MFQLIRQNSVCVSTGNYCFDFFTTAVLFLLTIELPRKQSSLFIQNQEYSFTGCIFNFNRVYSQGCSRSAVAIDVSVSSWMVITTIFISLFLGISKRRAELSGPNQENLEKQKKFSVIMMLYLLISWILLLQLALLYLYALYTVSGKTISAFHSDKLIYTTPLFCTEYSDTSIFFIRKISAESPTRLSPKIFR